MLHVEETPAVVFVVGDDDAPPSKLGLRKPSKASENATSTWDEESPAEQMIGRTFFADNEWARVLSEVQYNYIVSALFFRR